VGRSDLPGAVEFHDSDAALPARLPCQCMPLAQVAHHRPGAVRVGRRVSTVQRTFDLALDEVQRVTQSRAGFFELFDSRPPNGRTGRQASQQPGGDPVLNLVLGPQHVERRQFAECGQRPFEIPVTQQAVTVRIRRQVVPINRPPSRDHAQQVIAPHGVVERCLLQLLLGLLQQGWVRPEHWRSSICVLLFLLRRKTPDRPVSAQGPD
jgi:hypothetical protein